MNSFVTDISDDNHICIRCKKTIHGLSNYVEHRKNGDCEHMTADKFFNCLQLQYKYKLCEEEEEEDDYRSDNSHHNRSEVISDEDHSEEEVDIYRPPNNFTGGKWKPGSLQSNTSGVGITSYIIDSSSSDGSDVLHSDKRRNSDQTISQSIKRSQTNVESKQSNQLNESQEMKQKCIKDNNLCNIEDKECKSCGFVANNSFNLLKHCLSNHSNSDVFTSESIAKNESNLMRNLSFICEVCSFYTNQSNNYFWHLTTAAHNQKIGSQMIQFECRVCNKICDDVQKLMDHLETNQSNHSNTSGPLIICKLKKMRQKKDKTIKSFDKRLDQFKCDFCLKSFKWKTHLKKHSMSEHIRRVAFPDLIKSNFIGDYPKYSCLECDFKTDRESTHLLHSLNHEIPVLSSHENHKTKQSTNRPIKRSEDKYKCPLCHRPYICREMKKHINIHLRETPFECIQCDKKFSKMDYLKTHEKTHSGIKDKICKICGTGFVSNKLLSNHIKTHDSNRKKTFGCDECGVMFHTKFVLNQHIKRHLPKSERPFKCEFNGCHFSFVNKSELLSHSRVHSNSDEKYFLCDGCPYKTKSIYSLRKHSRQHTGDKHFECQFCSFKTYLSSNMIRHSRIHSGEKPYRCPYCSYVCNTQENIRKHILKTKKHKGLYVYPCNHCEYKTNLFSEFRKHIEESHSDLYSMEEIDGLVSHLFTTKQIN